MIKKLQELAKSPFLFTGTCLAVFLLAHAFFLILEIVPRSIQTRSQLSSTLYIDALKEKRFQRITTEEQVEPYRYVLDAKVVDTYSVREIKPSLMWWRVLPSDEPISSKCTRPKIFWRGEIAAYVQEAPIQAPDVCIKVSAYTIRYAL